MGLYELRSHCNTCHTRSVLKNPLKKPVPVLWVCCGRVWLARNWTFASVRVVAFMLLCFCFCQTLVVNGNRGDDHCHGDDASKFQFNGTYQVKGRCNMAAGVSDDQGQVSCLCSWQITNICRCASAQIRFIATNITRCVQLLLFWELLLRGRRS